MSDPYRSPASSPGVEPLPDPDRPGLLQTWTSSRACPICAVPLFAARRHGIRLDACGGCGGCFLPNDAARRLLDSTVSASVAAELAAIADASATAVGVPVGPRRCPDCNDEMKRTRVVRLEVDLCPNHGTWFDRTELVTLVARVLPDAGEADIVLPEGMTSQAAALRMPLVLFFGAGG